MDPDSGSIQLDGETIRYRSEYYGNWELLLSDVRVIGEATNQNGPVADDYFLCFASGPWMWREASFYAEGRDEFLKSLSERLGVEMRLSLQFSTDFASRVMWPVQLVGRPMFKFVHPPARWWHDWFIGLKDGRQFYSEEVEELLRNDVRCRRRWD